MRIRARHYETSQPVEIVCEKDRIASIHAATSDFVDLEAGWVAPALFDLQINGCAGFGFSSEKLTAEQINLIIQECRRHGIASFCPTLVTNSFAALAHGLAVVRKACETDKAVAAALPAIHLEGPYISPEDGPRGAHSRQHVRKPNWDEFRRLQDASGGRIRLVTVAPELNGGIPFIEELVRDGVVVSIGHTAATGPCIQAAIAAGARLSTHLGNGAHALLPRHPNYIWEQLAADDLWASIICDGHHLPPSVIQCILRVKTPARTILTCDASSLAGLPPGRYREWDQEFEVRPEGKVVMPGTDYLAGSWAFTDLCIGNVVRFAGVRLHEAIDMAGARPRQLLGLPPRRLQVGEPAELVLFNWQAGRDFQVVAVT